LTFLRGVLCLDSHYRARGKCKELPAAGYAHHAYTTRKGPFYRPPGPDDVTIGVLSRLTRALDRAGRAHRIAKHMPIWLTEFGIQSKPDPLMGVSLARYSGFESGLMTSSGKPKPAMQSFRLPLAAKRRGSSASLWGLVRPATGPT